MKLKRTVNFRFLFVALVFCFDVFLILPILPESLKFLPTVIVICWILRFIFDYGIYYENSYLYLKRGRGKISHQKDNPIIVQDVESFYVNNPCFILNGWCFSSKNITLVLKNNKSFTFSVKENDKICDYLLENNVPKKAGLAVPFRQRSIFLNLIIIAVNFYLMLFSVIFKSESKIWIICLIFQCIFWAIYLNIVVWQLSKDDRVRFFKNIKEKN